MRASLLLAGVLILAALLVVREQPTASGDDMSRAQRWVQGKYIVLLHEDYLRLIDLYCISLGAEDPTIVYAKCRKVMLATIPAYYAQQT